MGYKIHSNLTSDDQPKIPIHLNYLVPDWSATNIMSTEIWTSEEVMKNKKIIKFGKQIYHSNKKTIIRLPQGIDGSARKPVLVRATGYMVEKT